MQPTVNHVRPVADLKALKVQIKGLFLQHTKTIRLSYTERVRLGNMLIALKKLLPHGEFQAALQEIGIDPRYANRCMAEARQGYTKSPDSMTIEEIYAAGVAAMRAEPEEDSNKTMSLLSEAATPDDVPDFSTNSPAPTSAIAAPASAESGENGSAASRSVPEREPGDDHDAEGEPGAPETEAEAFKRIKGEYEAMKAHRAACRKKIEPKDKNGAHFEWGAFLNAWGTLLRQIDVVGNLYGCKETPDAEGLRRQNQQYKDNFRSWVRKVSKTEPPPEPHERNRNGHHSA